MTERLKRSGSAYRKSASSSSAVRTCEKAPSWTRKPFWLTSLEVVWIADDLSIGLAGVVCCSVEAATLDTSDGILRSHSCDQGIVGSVTAEGVSMVTSVSYTHLTLPTKRIV